MEAIKFVLNNFQFTLFLIKLFKDESYKRMLFNDISYLQEFKTVRFKHQIY